MKEARRSQLGTVGVALAVTTGLLASGAPALAAPNAAQTSGGHAGGEQAIGVQASATEGTVADMSETPAVEGTFSFTQGIPDSTEFVRAHVATASKYLCGASLGGEATGGVSPASWTVSIGGDCDTAYQATLEEMANDGAARLTMGCTCAANPAGGLASANADVMGATLASIMEKAGVRADANTVVFTSADGYEVALPLSYVRNRFSILAFDLNGEPLANSMGGTCQLWLGSTAASYFARDVVSITFETRQTPPPRPGSTESGDNYPTPNATIRVAES